MPAFYHGHQQNTRLLGARVIHATCLYPFAAEILSVRASALSGKRALELGTAT
jgi:hypothetical protein